MHEKAENSSEMQKIFHSGIAKTANMRYINKIRHKTVCKNIQAERWLSGRRRRSRKSLTGFPVRGFESLSLRHFYAQILTKYPHFSPLGIEKHLLLCYNQP